MKLSDMNTRELKNALLAITAPASVIVQSEAFVACMKKLSEAKKANATVGQLGGIFMAEVVPLLLDQHEHETFSILAVLTGKPVEEIMAQNGMQTIKEIRENVDGTLLGFFN